MTTADLEQLLARDPLALRLSRVTDPTVSSDLLGRVLSRQGVAWRRPARRARRVLLAGAVVLMGVAVLAATPAGPAIGRAILPQGLQQWFGLVSGAPSVITPPANACSAPSPRPTMVPGEVYWHTCPNGLRVGDFTPLYVGLATAQAQVTFHIETAAWLPAGLTLGGVAVFGNDVVDGPSSVSVEYLPIGHTGPGPGIRIQEHPGTQVGGSAVPASAVEHVTVDGQPAIFVKGDYESPRSAVGYWTPSADVEELSWQHGGLTFDMIASGLHLTAADLIRVAQSVP
jgi:hypothetical protein